MIVRESPRSGVRKDQPNWPPKSPHEALLSSPSARRKYESQRNQRTSVSPSPSKRRPLSRGLAEPDDDEEEDEETLQLKLQAIEARLKLKQLQKARKATESGDKESNASSSRPGTAASLRRVEISRPEPEVQVPVSPVRNRRAPEEQKSPARVLLGIDKGLRAQDVSLKRASSFSSRNPATSASRGGLSRTKSTTERELPKIKSFSERIAEQKNKEKVREEREAKIEDRRSRGFGLHSIEGLKERPISRSGSSLSSGTNSAQDAISSRLASRAQTRSINDLRNTSTPRPGSNLSTRTDSTRVSSSASRPSSGFGMTPTASKYAEISQRDNSSDAASFESFSRLHLKSREMQHNVVTRTLEGKTVLTIPQLLKTVKAPDYDPPDPENDYVVLGVICSKSSPLNTKNSRQGQSTGKDESAYQTGKFMVIRLTDLKWELDLYLFDTGFSQFWKLSVGTLIAVLNPDIMPPRNRDTGKFSLKLTSSDDTVLEIGVARDLDFCHAKRKDGKDCTQWVDGRKTEYCEFHLELQVEKSKRGRMEVNTMAGYGKGPSSGGKFGMFGGRAGGPKGDELRREGKYHDRHLQETMYIAPGVGGAAKLLDDDEQPWERGASREERFRKQLAAKEKERELAEKLGKMGQGSTGGDYMKIKGSNIPNLPSGGGSQPTESSRARSEMTADNDFGGLLNLNKKADDVSLAPVKRKRIISGKSTGSSEPVGWSGAFKRGMLLSPKKEATSSLRGTRETSPVKKKARLLLPEKGIREPGRDSLGGLDVGLLAAMDDDDDDDLEVV